MDFGRSSLLLLSRLDRLSAPALRGLRLNLWNVRAWMQPEVSKVTAVEEDLRGAPARPSGPLRAPEIELFGGCKRGFSTFYTVSHRFWVVLHRFASFYLFGLNEFKSWAPRRSDASKAGALQHVLGVLG